MAQGTVVDRLVLELRAETSQLRKDLNSVKKQLDGSKKSSQGLKISLSQVATALAAIGAAQIVGGIIQTTRTFEDLRATLKALTGSVDAADLSFKIIQDFTATTTFQLQGVTQGFITLLQAGITPTTDALRDFGNLAAAFDKDISVLAQAVFRAMTGEMEMLKQFNVVMKVEGDKFKATFNGVTTEVDRNGEAIADYIRSISRTNFPTALEDRANTLTGAISNLEDAFAVFQAQVGEEIRPVLIQLAKDMTDFFNNSESGAETVGTVLAGAFQFLADTTRLVINNMDVLKGVLIGVTSAMIINGLISMADLFQRILKIQKATARTEALILALRTRGVALIGMGAIGGASVAMVNKLLNDEDERGNEVKKDKNKLLEEEIANNERLRQVLAKNLTAQQLYTKSEMEAITTIQDLTKGTEKFADRLNRLFGFDLTKRTERFNSQLKDMRKIFNDQKLTEAINAPMDGKQRFLTKNPFDVDPFFFQNLTGDFGLDVFDGQGTKALLEELNQNPQAIADAIGLKGGFAKIYQTAESMGKDIPEFVVRGLMASTVADITGEDMFAKFLGFDSYLDMLNFSENILPIGNVQNAIGQFRKAVAEGSPGTADLGFGNMDEFQELRHLIDPQNSQSLTAFINQLKEGGFLPESFGTDMQSLQIFRSFLSGIVDEGDRAKLVLSPMADALMEIAEEVKNPTIGFEDFTDELLNNRTEMSKLFDEIQAKYPTMFTDLDEFIEFSKEGVNNLRDTVKSASEVFSGEMLQAVVSATNQFTNQFTQALLEGRDAMESFKSFAKNIVAQIISIFIQMAVVNKIINGIFGFSKGDEGYQPEMDVADIFNRQSGGKVNRGGAYMVGETGAELFVPDSSGTIMNSHRTKGMGGQTFVINQSLNFSTGVQQTVRAEVMGLMPKITEASKQAVSEASMRGGSFRRSLQGA